MRIFFHRLRRMLWPLIWHRYISFLTCWRCIVWTGAGQNPKTPGQETRCLKKYLISQPSDICLQCDLSLKNHFFLRLCWFITLSRVAPRAARAAKKSAESSLWPKTPTDFTIVQLSFLFRPLTHLYIHPHKYVSKQMDATNHLMFTDAHFLIPLFLTITCGNTRDTCKSLPLPLRHTYADQINQHTPNISLSDSPPLLRCTLPQPT